MDYGDPIVVPFLKWAGGKRWLSQNYRHLFPQTFTRYVEPFLGSGAVFFGVNPKKSILSDLNSNLINAYCAIRDDWRQVNALLHSHHVSHNSDYYYAVRSKIFVDRFKRAAQFIYLNRTCWNGLYRVNLKGVFNVPIGTKTSVVFDSDDFEGVAASLKKAKILCADFEIVIRRAREGDFLFVDPPYTTAHNFNGFVKYNEKIFSWDDQIRLRDSLDDAASRGAKICLTNADHESIRKLYRDFKTMQRVPRHSVLAGDAKCRTEISELIIRSY